MGEVDLGSCDRPGQQSAHAPTSIDEVVAACGQERARRGHDRACSQGGERGAFAVEPSFHRRSRRRACPLDALAARGRCRARRVGPRRWGSRRARRPRGRAAVRPARARSPRRWRGGRDTARSSVSSENGSRSSTDPPPRAMTMTSTSGSGSSSCSASIDLGTAAVPCTAMLRTSKRTAGQRTPGVLDHVVLGRTARPQIRPIGAGQERERPLAVGGEQALGGEQRLQPLEPCQQLAEPDGPDLARRRSESVPRPV